MHDDYPAGIPSSRLSLSPSFGPRPWPWPGSRLFCVPAESVPFFGAAGDASYGRTLPGLRANDIAARSAAFRGRGGVCTAGTRWGATVRSRVSGGVGGLGLLQTVLRLT